MSNEKIRSEFESWALKEEPFLHVFSFSRKHNGTYLQHATNLCWATWQAALSQQPAQPDYSAQIEATPANQRETMLYDTLVERDSLKQQVDESTATLTRKNWLIRQVLDSLPMKRDWLNPDYEAEMKESK